VKRPLPLASEDDYIKHGHSFILDGAKFLALPGCVTDDPKKGASLYNDNLINHYMSRQDSLNTRLEGTFIKFEKNRRIKKISELLASNKAFKIHDLSNTEQFLLLKSLS